ncbi:MAG: hypothetical protein EOO07_02765 [Chitinophagaceae bacterium]|nr:MAG: hypothetical protein EOO07_02765 [Chitinophagaceae bacterium]
MGIGPLRFTGTDFIRKNFMATASYVLRRGFYRRHSFGLGYSYTEISDSIHNFYNKRYFNTGKSKAAFTDISYNYQYINTNNVNYPLTGKLFTLTLAKRGFGWEGGLNMFSVDANYNRYFKHSAKWYSMLQTHVKLKTDSRAYINQAAMGYGDFYLQGLEKYVIDGWVTALARYTLKRKLVSFKIPVPLANKHLNDIPVTIFAKTYANTGFSGIQKEFDTKFGNRFLYSGGFGIDVLTLYDLNFRIEYSFNQLGEKGLFLHAKGGF